MKRKTDTFFEKFKNKELDGRVTNIGQLNFNKDIFDNETMTPHKIMRKSIKYYETEPNTRTGTDLLATFIKPECVKVISNDPVTADFWKIWLDKRPKFDDDMDNFIAIALASGNAYYEQVFKGEDLNNLFTINDPAKVYYNLRDDVIKDTDKYWIFEVPVEAKMYLGQRVQTHHISYIKGGRFFQDFVWGVALPKEKVKHFKLGWSTDDYYGRAIFSSGLDTLDVMREIIKSYAIRARYKSIGRKIWFLGTDTNPASPQDVDDFLLQSSNLNDEDDIVLNKQVGKLDVDQTNSDSMTSELEYVRKSSTGSLVPNYITPFAEDVNRATSEEAKIPFELRLNKMRRKFLKFFNDTIIKEIQKQKSYLKDAEFDFGVVDLNTRRDKIEGAVQLYQLNALTYNELREAFGLDPIKNGNVFMKDIEAPTQGDFGPDNVKPNLPKTGDAPQEEIMNDEQKNVKESSDEFKQVVEDIKEELRNWTCKVDDADAVVKFSKMYYGTHFTFFISERPDGEYVVQLYERQDRKDKKVVQKDEVINCINSLMAFYVSKQEAFQNAKHRQTT